MIIELPAYTTTILCDIYHATSDLVNYGALKNFDPHRALLEAYPSQVRQLLDWGLAHRDELTLPPWQMVWNLGRYLVGTLGMGGTAQTADLLRHHYVHDAELGQDAMAAVHDIDARVQS